MTLEVDLEPGETTGTAMFRLTPTDDVVDTVNGEVAISAAVTDPAAATKANRVAYTLGSATIVITDNDS